VRAVELAVDGKTATVHFIIDRRKPPPIAMKIKANKSAAAASIFGKRSKTGRFRRKYFLDHCGLFDDVAVATSKGR